MFFCFHWTSLALTTISRFTIYWLTIVDESLRSSRLNQLSDWISFFSALQYAIPKALKLQFTKIYLSQIVNWKKSNMASTWVEYRRSYIMIVFKTKPKLNQTILFSSLPMFRSIEIIICYNLFRISFNAPQTADCEKKSERGND